MTLRLRLPSSQNSCPTFALSKCHARRSHTSSAVLARELFLRAVLTTHTLHSTLFDSTCHSYSGQNETEKENFTFVGAGRGISIETCQVLFVVRDVSSFDL